VGIAQPAHRCHTTKLRFAHTAIQNYAKSIANYDHFTMGTGQYSKK
jgi:hypothetical protein